MRLSLPAASLVLAVPCALSGPAAAQCPSLELRFAAPGPSGVVTALASLPRSGGDVLVAGGAFAVVGGRVAGSIGAWDGERWSTLAGGVDGTLEALVVHDLGAGPELVAGGDFALAGGVAAANVARFDGTAWSALGAGLDGRVRALLVHDFGAGPELVAAGDFTGRVARFDGAAWSVIGGGLDGPGNALASYDDGLGARLVVAGDFTQAGGVPCSNVARLDGAAWTPLGAGTDGTVFALATVPVSGGEDLVLGGSFATAGAVSADNVARFDGSSFAPLGAGLPASFTGLGVRALVADAGGIVAGGTFDLGGGSVNVARFDGAAWQPLDLGLGTSPLFEAVHALARFDAGEGEELFGGGAFGSAGDLPRQIAHWDGASWRALRDADAQGIVHMPSENGPVSMTLWQGELVIVGEFDGAGEAAARDAARWNGSEWSPLATPPGQVASFEGAAVVRALELGGTEELVLGMVRATPADVAVPLYRWGGASWLPFAAGSSPEADTRVADVAVFDDGTGEVLWAAGYRLRVDAGAVAEAVVRWNGSGWERPVAGATAALDGLAHRLAVHDDGGGAALFVGGNFAGGVRRWTGSAWDTLGAGLPPGVAVLCELDDGSGPKLWASGAFTAHQGLAVWDGTAWATAPGVGVANLAMSDLAAFDDGSGAGTRIFGQTLNDELVVLDGGTWSTVASTDPYFTMARMAAFADLPGGPGIVLAGDFREVDLVAQAGFAIRRGCDAFPSFCDASDGSLAACPCANPGAPDTGCDLAQGTGGVGLDVAAQNKSSSSATLVASGFPVAASPAAVVIRSSALDPAAPVVFGDGLRCVATASLVRLAATNAAGGTSTHAIGHGAMAGSGSFRYQVWFRNTPSTFCDAGAAFNLSNGRTLTWP